MTTDADDFGNRIALLPRPADWRPGLEITGNWWPHVDAADRLSPHLEDFLAAGPRPALITFGSMAAEDGTGQVLKAVQRSVER
ncbi:hypothetical protein [Streptomyces phaeochromogenes]|uniref:hypothetical protein n=1 Tax=Streptomyces phaeochromogenes TaxID=1923 RepID=UPI0039A06DF9